MVVHGGFSCRVTKTNVQNSSKEFAYAIRTRKPLGNKEVTPSPHNLRLPRDTLKEPSRVADVKCQTKQKELKVFSSFGVEKW